ncbi:VanZ family protein [Luteimonas sp. MC1895]|uniref:VanZ family protein n=1 Tax=Luteimonas sp. MC1895 TaxID=2819513 RepID=UPI0018F0F534|nr:VanZ family protein [Luteimonas sp. MC1895]MBJ6979907.1 VanZ family protein [Luteimonas sp. MC1895]
MTARRPRLGRSLKPLRWPWAWCALWCLAIAAVVAFSLMPAPDLPEAPGSDKLHHFLAYFMLAASAVQLFARWPALLGAGLGLVLLGIGLEHAQGAMAFTRMEDRMDALANTLGVIAGLATRLTPLHDLLLRIEARLAPAARG